MSIYIYTPQNGASSLAKLVCNHIFRVYDRYIKLLNGGSKTNLELRGTGSY